MGISKAAAGVGIGVLNLIYVIKQPNIVIRDPGCFISHVFILTVWVSILMVENGHGTSQYLAMFQIEIR